MGRAGRLAGRVGLLLAVALGSGLGVPVAAYADPVGSIVDANGPDAIPGSYIVVLKDFERNPYALTGRYGGVVVREYDSAVHGFSARMSSGQAARMAADPAVAYVQQDARVALSGAQPHPPSWGLDRIDQRGLPLGGWYMYPDVPTATVHAYVIDTGLRTTHVEFGGRASNGWDFIDNDPVADDCNGHGTHVAGTIGGATFGVAKSVQLVGVRVLDCSGSGSYSQIIAGIDWVTANAVKPAVANLSLGGPADRALDDAVRASIASGVTYVVAAANDNTDACTISPADTAEAITVAASDSNDQRASFSDWGSCVDLFAPGVNIESAYGTGDSTVAWMSGTSMATPHVSGAAALILAAHPDYTPAQVTQVLLDNATTGRVGQAGAGTPNRLLYVTGGGADPAPVAVVAPCWQVGNGARIGIRDRGTVTSGVRVANCGGRASRASRVAVSIAGGRRGDYQIDLIAPNGRAYRLRNPNRDKGSGLNVSYQVNLSAVSRNGGWTLRVRDTRRGYTGVLSGWGLSV
ncbi:MAG: S8 family peptidase [Actinobacteria bacterium]|nr:MAG: S8 family peptidase [Actinomycetota bacterium]